MEPHEYKPFDYEGCVETDPDKVEKIVSIEDGKPVVHYPIKWNLQKPKGADGAQRDQTNDAAKNMRYAATLNLPQLKQSPMPRMGRAIIVGGAPSIADHLGEIRRLASDPDNAIFALNWSHTWLLERNIVPHGCVLFEIDAEPDTVLKASHEKVTYYICSHCSGKTFDELSHRKHVLWHSPPNSPGEQEVSDEFFKDEIKVGGGIGTFLRTISVAMCVGYRNFEIFGCDSSFPLDSESTHVKGYETANDVRTDAFYVWAKQVGTNKMRQFKTVGYLALQVEEFKEYCRINHHWFALRVHGDSLLRFAHEADHPAQYQLL